MTAITWNTTDDFETALKAITTDLQTISPEEKCVVNQYGDLDFKYYWLAARFDSLVSEMKSIAWANRDLARKIWTEAEIEIQLILADRFGVY